MGRRYVIRFNYCGLYPIFWYSRLIGPEWPTQNVIQYAVGFFILLSFIRVPVRGTNVHTTNTKIPPTTRTFNVTSTHNCRNDLCLHFHLMRITERKGKRCATQRFIMFCIACFCAVVCEKLSGYTICWWACGKRKHSNNPKTNALGSRRSTTHAIPCRHIRSFVQIWL